MVSSFVLPMTKNIPCHAKPSKIKPYRNVPEIIFSQNWTENEKWENIRRLKDISQFRKMIVKTGKADSP